MYLLTWLAAWKVQRWMRVVGQIRQIHPSLRQNVDLLIPRSAIESLESSHLRNVHSIFAELSILRIEEALHGVHLHLCLPAALR